MSKLKWKLKSSDVGYYIECPKCERKVGMNHVIFGDRDYSTCPDCGSEMDKSSLDFDYSELYYY